MPIINNQWKSDNYKFVGKAFDIMYANLMNDLKQIVGEASGDSLDYEITGTGGFGEMQRYDGSNLNTVSEHRAFKAIITPEEYTSSAQIGFKQAKVDKSGECAKVGQKLGYSAAITVYMHMLRMFGGAFNAAKLGGDGKAWAATDHPVASKASKGRIYIADPDAGTYSNLVALALSGAAISKVETQVRRFVTPDGAPLACKFDTLLVSPEMEEQAAKICGPDSRINLAPKKNPDDSSNAANPHYGLGYIVIGGGADGLSGKQWAMCDRTIMKNVVKLYQITAPTVFDNELPNPLIQQFTAYADFGIGWGDARQIIFSNPA